MLKAEVHLLSLTTVSGVDEGVPKKLQRVGQASAKPPHQQQQQRRFIVSDDAPKLDDLLSKQVNGSHDTNAATKRRIRLNRPALQEA
uniref:Uncharacterized protein n=1 Tax=Plectus sambesii TaxID=2011161 RepID=A0A914WYZ3_9BILA